ncbi:MAG TPA: DUF4394 domain-containing protein [Blastocatellia bacterium]|nr:DUF4394 domain-containing protein [Blastocatellia bacterium]
MRKMTLVLLSSLLLSPVFYSLSSAQGIPSRAFNTCGETIFALTPNNMLLTFNSDTPGVITRSVTVTGLQPGESLLGIDFRPAVREMFGVTNQNRIYIIDTTTGAASGLARLTATLPVVISGAGFGVDFNPVPDRLRVVSTTGQNFRINVETGVTAVDGNLAYATGDPNAAATPNVVGSAYSNNFAGATTTTLYGIDSNLDILVIQNPPNNGTLNTVGSLGVNTTNMVGFDIAAGSFRAFASLTPDGGTTSNLYTINLSTGAATLVGQIGAGVSIRDIAVAPRPPLTVFALTERNRLITFSAANPEEVISLTRARTLRRGETLLDIDFRPANGRLYALGDSSTLYSINLNTGTVTPRPVAPFSTALNGASFGFDFNPTVDRIRVVSEADQNLRLNPDSGDIAGVDGALAFAAGDANAGQNPNVVGSAYTNNFAGATTTILYGIDTNRDVLVTQIPPNNGTLNTVGSLGVDATDLVGFDIFGCDMVGYAALTLPGETASKLYRINLATGAATLIGTIGGGELIKGIALR